jgi:hypothetical protein
MKNPVSTASLFRGAALVAVVGLLGIGSGCANEQPQPQLTLQSLEHGQTFTHAFSKAYVSRDRDGDVDLVLLDRAAERAMIGMSGEMPIRQVMHLRVLWNPKRDQKAEHNSASNATVHWYVMGNTPESAADVLEYAGTAFVLVDDSGNGSELTIRNAKIRPVACRGYLQDPVGTSVFQGTIRATENRQRVREALATIRTAVAAINSPPKNLSATARPEVPSSMAQ